RAPSGSWPRQRCRLPARSPARKEALMRRRLVSLAMVVTVLVAILTLLIGGDYAALVGGRLTDTARGAPAATVTNVDDVGALANPFNEASGHPRLLLLLSPT